MNTILVNFYNLIIKQNFYSIRWLKVLDIMIEKGKGPVIRKLYIIQLIEVDLQMIMRICVNTRNKYQIEKNIRILKCNYRLRLNYSIKMAILEK